MITHSTADLELIKSNAKFVKTLWWVLTILTYCSILTSFILLVLFIVHRITGCILMAGQVLLVVMLALYLPIDIMVKEYYEEKLT